MVATLDNPFIKQPRAPSQIITTPSFNLKKQCGVNEEGVFR